MELKQMNSRKSKKFVVFFYRSPVFSGFCRIGNQALWKNLWIGFRRRKGIFKAKVWTKLWGLLRAPFHPFRITQTITLSALHFLRRGNTLRENNFFRFQNLPRLEIMQIDWDILSVTKKTETLIHWHGDNNAQIWAKCNSSGTNILNWANLGPPLILTVCRTHWNCMDRHQNLLTSPFTYSGKCPLLSFFNFPVFWTPYPAMCLTALQVCGKENYNEV